MSNPASLEKSDYVITATGRKATVLYLHKRASSALVKYDDDKTRARLPLSCLTKLDDAERSQRSIAALERWALKGVAQ